MIYGKGRDVPINETGQGNSDNTPIKQESYAYFLYVHADIVMAMQKKWAWIDRHYYLIDINAGTGSNADGTEGSIRLAQRIIRERGHKLIAWAIEKRHDAVEQLRLALGDVSPFTILEGDNAALLQKALLPKDSTAKYGLVYADPNGAYDFPLDTIVAFFANHHRATKYLDLLVSISATALKRSKGTGILKYKLSDIMQRVDKKYWYLREPRPGDPWTWTMLLGINWPLWPELTIPLDGQSRTLEFRRVSNPEWQHVVDRLTMTMQERQALLQKKIPQLILPIEPTENIWPIPGSEPYGPRL